MLLQGAGRRGNSLMTFLDTNLVIYYLDQPPGWGPKATAALSALQGAGERLAVSDLVRMECQVGPLKAWLKEKKGD